MIEEGVLKGLKAYGSTFTTAERPNCKWIDDPPKIWKEGKNWKVYIVTGFLYRKASKGELVPVPRNTPYCVRISFYPKGSVPKQILEDIGQFIAHWDRLSEFDDEELTQALLISKDELSPKENLLRQIDYHMAHAKKTKNDYAKNSFFMAKHFANLAFNLESDLSAESAHELVIYGFRAGRFHELGINQLYFADTLHGKVMAPKNAARKLRNRDPKKEFWNHLVKVWGEYVLENGDDSPSGFVSWLQIVGPDWDIGVGPNEAHYAGLTLKWSTIRKNIKQRINKSL